MINLYQEKEPLISEIGVKNKDGFFIRNMFVTSDSEIQIIRSSYNNTAIHRSVWQYNDVTNIDEAYLYGDFYMDFDSHVDFEHVREDAIKSIALLKVIFNLKTEDINIFFSGSKGVHLTVSAKVLGIEPDKKLHEIYKYIANYIRSYLKWRENGDNDKYKTLDIQPYHKRSTLRVRDSIHEKTGLYKTQITLDELVNKPLNDIKEICKSPRHIIQNNDILNTLANKSYLDFKKKVYTEVEKRSNIKVKSTLDFVPPCVQMLLSTPTSKGNRNYIATLLSSHFKSRGYDYETAEKLLEEWNETYCSPKIAVGELKQTLRSIYQGNKQYGCQSFSEVTGCDLTWCKLGKRKVNNNGK